MANQIINIICTNLEKRKELNNNIFTVFNANEYAAGKKITYTTK